MNNLQDARFLPGQKIDDHYILGEQIAIGGMGQVFLAFQESMNRQVAIKFLPPVDSENADTVARFEREVNMISRLEHPHIVPVYGFGDIDGIPYIVMRHMSGGTLRDHFQGEELNLQRALAVIDQMVTALDYAHEQGIIHRDLKPSNIFLDERNNAYLADFGLAKTVSGEHDLTRTDEGISGTPEYMSPEQVRGLKLDGRTDIYSLGVIVFQILAGQAPFSGSNPMETVLMQISSPIPSIVALQPELPKELDAVFNKVLSKTVNDRYTSAKEFAADLRTVLESKPLTWVPSTSKSQIDDELAEGKTEVSITPPVDRTEVNIARPDENVVNDSAHDGTRWFEKPRLLIGASIAFALVLIGLAFGGYQLFTILNNPIRQLEATAISQVDSPFDIEFDQQGGAWVINHEAGQVVQLQADCDANVETCGSILDQIDVGSRPLFLTLGNNEILVGRQLSQGLLSISLEDHSIRLIDFPNIPADAVIYGRSIWITSGQDILELDSDGQLLESFPAGNTPGSLYQTEDYIWVALEGEARLRRFNLITRSFDIDTPLSDISPNQLISLTGDENNQQIWASFNRDNLLVQVDSLTGQFLGSYDTKTLPVDIAVYDNQVWVAAKGDNEVTAYQGLSGSLIGGISSINSPLTMAVEPCEPGCANIWVASELTGNIYKVDITP